MRDPSTPCREGVQSASTNALRRVGYAVVRDLIDRALADTLWWHARARAKSGQTHTDSQVPGAPAAYRDAVMERILEWLQPSIKELSGWELHPTYSYYRVYRHGDVLKKHVDRPSCQLSVTLNLGQESGEAMAARVRDLGRRVARRAGTGRCGSVPGNGLPALAGRVRRPPLRAGLPALRRQTRSIQRMEIRQARVPQSPEHAGVRTLEPKTRIPSRPEVPGVHPVHITVQRPPWHHLILGS